MESIGKPQEKHRDAKGMHRTQKECIVQAWQNYRERIGDIGKASGKHRGRIGKV